MKKLLLIRHAKATHESGFDDFERPLTPSGMQDAATMAERLRASGTIPELLVASPALRTLSTANIFSQHFPTPKPLKEKAIYEASESTLLQVINEFPDNADFVALVGHNPGISQILYYLTGAFQDMETSGVALIELEVDAWAEVSGDSGKLISYGSPKTSA